MKLPVSVDLVLFVIFASIAGGVTLQYKQSLLPLVGKESLAQYIHIVSVTLSATLANPFSWGTCVCLAWAFLVGVTCKVLYHMWVLFTHPNDFVKMDVDPVMGTDVPSRLSMKTVGGAPPPFPNGWFRCLDTVDLPPHSNFIHSEFVCGQKVIVFRNQDNQARILDAHCRSCRRHCGDGRLLEGGRFVECPNADCQDRKQSTASREANPNVRYCDEANGEIYLWYSGDNGKPRYKFLTPPEMNGEFIWHGRTEHLISAHAAEIPENGADVAHLNILHSEFIVPWLQWLLSHHWTADWNTDKVEPHNTEIKIAQKMIVCRKWALPGSEVKVTVRQNGPGLVFLHFRTPLGKAYVIESVTPTHPLLMRYHHIVWSEWRMPRIVGKGLVQGLVAQAERDIPVWNYKTYMHKPMLVKGDGPLMRFRRWFGRHYDETSMTWEQYFARLQKESDTHERKTKVVDKEETVSSMFGNVISASHLLPFDEVNPVRLR